MITVKTGSQLTIIPFIINKISLNVNFCPELVTSCCLVNIYCICIQNTVKCELIEIQAERSVEEWLAETFLLYNILGLRKNFSYCK